MSRHDENIWRAQLRARRPHVKRKLSRHYPRLRARRAWNALPMLKVALGVAVVLVLLKVAIRLAV